MAVPIDFAPGGKTVELVAPAGIGSRKTARQHGRWMNFENMQPWARVVLQ
jgi:hypothetical protein